MRQYRHMWRPPWPSGRKHRFGTQQRMPHRGTGRGGRGVWRGMPSDWRVASLNALLTLRVPKCGTTAPSSSRGSSFAGAHPARPKLSFFFTRGGPESNRGTPRLEVPQSSLHEGDLRREMDKRGFELSHAQDEVLARSIAWPRGK